MGGGGGQKEKKREETETFHAISKSSADHMYRITILKKAKADVEMLVTNYTYGDGPVVPNAAPYFFSEKNRP